MPLQFNIRHLEQKNLRLAGELSAAELDMDTRDPMVRVAKPLRYDLEVQKLEDRLLIQGELRMTVDCECVRCLEAFEREVELCDWTCLLELQGEEPVAVVNDLVDLTPCLREDTLLALPQHPVCKPECAGLLKTPVGKTKPTGDTAPLESGSSVWTELNKLKL